MKILYIYPHPDDESFGPAGAMHFHQRQGHQVYLLTLTRGEATKKRFELGVEKEEMGQIRTAEMEAVARTLKLTNLTLFDMPDNQLKELDPRQIEVPIADHIRRINPHVVVTYPVHGISGFQDHLVTHAIVKRVYVSLREDTTLNLKRLAFIAYPDGYLPEDSIFNLHSSTAEEIDCTMTTEQADLDAHLAALDCYTTYQDTIERSGVKNTICLKHSFEIFAEDHNPYLHDLFEGLE